MKSEEKLGLWLAVLAVVFFATSPIFTIWADPLSPYEKAAWRMVIGSATILLIAVVQGQIPHFRRADGGQFLLFGLVTAIHFLTYMAALSFTSIAHTLTLVYTSPIFVTLFSAWFLKEPIASRKYVGIAVTILGVAVMVGFEPELNRRMLIGDGLALLSGLTFAIYSVIGRSQRNRYPLLSYAFATYGMAGLYLLPAAVLNWTPGGYGVRQVLALVGVGVFPLALGHTLYNAAVRRTHATYVNVISTQEITGGIILGALLLGQLPTANSVLGALITLGGIILVLVS